MHCLIVKSPYANQIVDGTKKEEYRSRRTHIRGEIGIIEAGTSRLIGSVCLIDCIPKKTQFGNYAWILKNPQRFNSPVSYQHPKGAQTWVILSAK